MPGGARSHSQDGEVPRRRTQQAWWVVGAISAFWLAVALAASANAQGPDRAVDTSGAADRDGRAPNEVRAGAEATSAPASPHSVRGSSVAPVDLRPRPLGPNRPAQPVTGATQDQPSAVAAMWANPLVRTTGSLALVLLLIFALAVIARRVGGRGGGGLIGAMGPGGRAPAGLLEVLGRYPLARGQTLILLKVDARVLLLAQTTPRIRGGVGTLTTLCEIRDPEEVASILVKAGEHDGGSANAKFSAMLHAFDRSHAGKNVESDEEFTQVDPRRVEQSEEGDRTEMWDERAAAPVIHKFPVREVSPPMVAPVAMPQMQSVSAYAQQQANAYGAYGNLAPTGTESFGSLKQRLQALRGEAHR